MTVKLRVADEIFVEHPEVMISVVVVHGLANSQDNAELDGLLREAEAALPSKMGSKPVSQHPHVAPWREAYRKFGARPKIYPLSM